MPMTIDNEVYLNRTEAAELLGVSLSWFSKEIVPKYRLEEFQRGIRKREVYYKKAQLEPLLGLRPREDEEADGHK